MKKILLIISIILSLAACQNDGRIGSLFGTWGLASMTVNGAPAEDVDPELTTWSFQNNIVRIVLDGPHHAWTDRTGTWSRTSRDGKNYLELDFTHGEDDIAPGSGPYKAPEWLGFPENRVVPLEFVKDSSREMILTWTDDDGKVYVYTLKKTW